MSTVDKAGVVLRAVSELAPVTQMAPLEERTGIPKPTLYRILRTLLERDMIQQDASGAYRVGDKVFALAARAFPRLGLDEDVRRVLIDLSRQVHQAIHLSALRGDDLIYVDKIEADTPFYLQSAIGRHQAIHSSSIGKSVLANLPEARARHILEHSNLEALTPYTVTSVADIMASLPRIRERGFARDDEEDELSTRAVGTCLRDRSGAVVGGLSIVAPAFQVEMAELDAQAPQLLAAAATIEEVIAGRGLLN
ncbi:IclR family transcriptional regulator [Microbacterium sp. K24]|uniref:IclR family transcriptional regulator n=1 Tax=Microbacterium sp. K24 TaxID=2305446 RepID=UPI00109CEDDC|nr:IclR family transcriptional regulator [Microbacterium sp. K24]